MLKYLYIVFDFDESYNKQIDTESRRSVRAGETPYLSTFGVVDEESRVGDLYITVLSGRFTAIWVATRKFFRPMNYVGDKTFFICPKI